MADRRSLLWVLALLVCGISTGVTAAEGSPRGGPFEEGIALASSERGLEEGANSTSFNLLELRDLWVRVNVARLPRTSVLALTFTSPRGEIFHETRVLYSRETRAMDMRLPGASRSVTAFPAKPLAGGFALDQAIPIGIGAFVQYPQPGTWRIQATLDGRHEPLSVEMDLRVTP